MRSRVGGLVPSEHDEQKAVTLWANALSVRHPELRLLFAIPNGGHRNKAAAGKLKAEGVKRGVPDLCLPYPRNGWHGLFLEMKRLKGGRMTADQQWWHDQLSAHGYMLVLARGAEEAIRALERYLGIGG